VFFSWVEVKMKKVKCVIASVFVKIFDDFLFLLHKKEASVELIEL